MNAKLRITQTGSLCRRTKKQRACLAGLGLGHRGRTVIREDNPSIRGMIAKVSFLLQVQECSDGE